MQGKPEVPVNCFFQGCYNPAYEAEIHKAKKKCYEYNKLCPTDYKEQKRFLKICSAQWEKKQLSLHRFGAITDIT